MSRRNQSASALIIVLIALVSSAAQAAVCGQLAAVKGKAVEVLRVQAGRAGDSVRYVMRVDENKVLPLECDDVVIAGRDSSARIVLANAKLTLAPESRIELAAHTKTQGNSPAQVSLVNLTYGKMRALVKKPAAADAPKPGEPVQAGKKTSEPQVNFRVRTFSAVAGVRGTDFFTSYDLNSGLTEQATIEGAVEVSQAGSQNKVLVEAGKQVAVETTPAAVAAAQERIKTGKDESLEPPRQLPSATAPTKPLKVVPIEDSLRQTIRMASAVAKDDADFAHPKAIETIGQPDTWTLEREKVPEKHKSLKNEF